MRWAQIKKLLIVLVLALSLPFIMGFGDSSSIVSTLLIGLVIAAVVFLILREVVCWYWKINEIVSLQKQIVELLKGRQAAPEESAWRNLAAAAAIPAPAAPPPPVAGKKCSNCGYAVGENEAYCPNCGRSTA